MTLHKISTEGWRCATAEIVDFETARLSRRLTMAQDAAAEALAACRAGQGSLNVLMRALIAPFSSALP